MVEAGCEKILFFPLYPHYAGATSATANDQFFRSLMKEKRQPAARTVAEYFDHPLYIDALAQSVERAYAALDHRPDVLVASYHGMPKRYLMSGDPYHCQCAKTSRLLRERLMGSAYADKLSGNSAANQLNGGAGADTLTGGDGNDTYTIDNTGDRISETNAGSSGGVDTLISSLASTTLGANIENGRISSTGAASLTGNGLANVLTAGAGNNTLNGSSGTDTADYSTAASAVTLSLALAGAQATGGSGSDTLVSIEDLAGSAFNDKLTGSSAVNVLRGAAGADTLSGGAGADTFVISSLSGSDTITDFASTSDKLLVSQAGVRVGDGDALLEGARTLAGPGGFAASAELVVLSANITGSLSAGSAAAAIGSATGGYTAGARVLFMVDNGSSSALYLFTSAGADALVSSSELALLATLTGTPATGTADLLFGA
jgi:hypothetical protein